jgi:hypothetical protein
MIPEAAEGTAPWRRRVVESVLGRSLTHRLRWHKQRAVALARSSLSTEGRRAKHQLTELRNRFVDKRCIIIGNGPSLNNTNLQLVQGELTFGLNRIYLMFDELGFATTFHVVVNQYVAEQCSDDLIKVPGRLFTTWSNRVHFRRRRDVVYLRQLTTPGFSSDVRCGIWEGATVTYVAMQLAFHMGFRQVILIGVDHRFKDGGPAHKVVTAQGPDMNHFDPSYFGPGFRWQLPDLHTSELAYRIAHDTFQRAGRQIVDATVDGALKIFPKAPLEELLE